MKRLYTIDQVSELTGINKRTLKYYIERDMISPSDKKVEGSKPQINRLYFQFGPPSSFPLRSVSLRFPFRFSCQSMSKNKFYQL